MDFGNCSGCHGLQWGQAHAPELSIWTTMIPGYSFPAAQQAQISEHLLVHTKGLWLKRTVLKISPRNAEGCISFVRSQGPYRVRP